MSSLFDTLDQEGGLDTGLPVEVSSEVFEMGTPVLDAIQQALAFAIGGVVVIAVLVRVFAPESKDKPHAN